MEKLKEWTLRFVKHKDLLSKKLKGYDESNNILTFHFKDGDKKYLLKESLDDSVFEFSRSKGQKAIVCLKGKENLKFLIDNWDEFKDMDLLILIFVDLNTNEKWLINPKTHHNICDESSLVQGLESMYNSSFGI